MIDLYGLSDCGIDELGTHYKKSGFALCSPEVVEESYSRKEGRILKEVVRPLAYVKHLGFNSLETTNVLREAKKFETEEEAREFADKLPGVWEVV